MLEMKVPKVGNSLEVVLPKEVLLQLNAQDGDLDTSPCRGCHS